MKVLICQGIHDPALTGEFLASLKSSFSSDSKLSQPGNILVFSEQNHYLSLSAFHILQFMQERLGSPTATPPVVFIGFSAGVVGAVGAATCWQLMGGLVKALIAFDGWGVPLFGNFPLHRLSHDFFTHSSSSILGSGADSFYADPPVEHLTLWRSPQTSSGWWIKPDRETQPPRRMTAAEFLIMLLNRYAE